MRDASKKGRRRRLCQLRAPRICVRCSAKLRVRRPPTQYKARTPRRHAGQAHALPKAHIPHLQTPPDTLHARGHLLPPTRPHAHTPRARKESLVCAAARLAPKLPLPSGLPLARCAARPMLVPFALCLSCPLPASGSTPARARRHTHASTSLRVLCVLRTGPTLPLPASHATLAGATLAVPNRHLACGRTCSATLCRRFARGPARLPFSMVARHNRVRLSTTQNKSQIAWLSWGRLALFER